MVPLFSGYLGRWSPAGGALKRHLSLFASLKFSNHRDGGPALLIAQSAWLAVFFHMRLQVTWIFKNVSVSIHKKGMGGCIGILMKRLFMGNGAGLLKTWTWHWKSYLLSYDIKRRYIFCETKNRPGCFSKCSLSNSRNTHSTTSTVFGCDLTLHVMISCVRELYIQQKSRVEAVVKNNMITCIISWGISNVCVEQYSNVSWYLLYMDICQPVRNQPPTLI